MWELRARGEDSPLVKALIVSYCEDGTTRTSEKLFKVGEDFLVTLEAVVAYCSKAGIAPIKIFTAWYPESLLIDPME